LPIATGATSRTNGDADAAVDAAAEANLRRVVAIDPELVGVRGGLGIVVGRAEYRALRRRGLA
jgi:hypothetical protein